MSSTETEEPNESQPLGRRARKALATRNALFAAGLAAFENRPLSLVSVLDITEATDVAKGVFYLHFGGKDEYLAALWEYVQRSFLDALRQRLATCRSRVARIEEAARHYHARIEEAPRRCRFWLRMASYFGDELGQPGHLARLRHEYLRQLAALVHGIAEEDVAAEDLRAALVLDGLGWAMISQAFQFGDTPLDEEAFVRATRSALRDAAR